MFRKGNNNDDDNAIDDDKTDKQVDEDESDDSIEIVCTSEHAPLVKLTLFFLKKIKICSLVDCRFT